MGIFRDSKQEEQLSAVVNKARLNANYRNFIARAANSKRFSLDNAVAVTNSNNKFIR